MFNFPYIEKGKLPKKLDTYLGAGSRSNVEMCSDMRCCCQFFVATNKQTKKEAILQKNLWSGKFIGIVYRTYKATLNSSRHPV